MNPAEVKILVAEDNPINQKVIRIILERHGLSYEIALDGEEAVRKYRDGDFQLILMDCQMPNLDGLSASRQIRDFEASNLKKRCPIVAMTANTMKGDRERCISAGMDDFLAKPFKSQDLVGVINQWRKHDGESQAS